MGPGDKAPKQLQFGDQQLPARDKLGGNGEPERKAWLKRNSCMKEFLSRNARRSTAPFRDPGWKSDRKEQGICTQREENLGGVRF